MHNARRTTIIAVIVLIANAGLMALQLLASRWLVPFIGSSLETWTCIIGMFLLGIALGNAVGGRLADRYPSHRMLSLFLILGAITALCMIGLPRLLSATGAATNLPQSLRVPFLSFAECFPAGFVLALITPLVIKLGLRDLARTGRTAGTIFALGTLGCLASNYAIGFVLIPMFTITTITLAIAALFMIAAILSLCIPNVNEAFLSPNNVAAPVTVSSPELTIRNAAIIVFFCSFCGMALELTAARILAQVVGVSLYTWTGVIGVMLAGTATGNWLGGRLADRSGDRIRTLVLALFIAMTVLLAVLPAYFLLSKLSVLTSLPLMPQILAYAFVLFFLPMMLLGTISPQVIKLTLTATTAAGRTAGRIYAWSTAGAIVGTFATGYGLISGIGMYRTVLLTVVIVALATVFVQRAWDRRWVSNTVAALIGLALAEVIVFDPARDGITLETNYFTIRVYDSPRIQGGLELGLDKLTHSVVIIDDPAFLHYPHERIQRELLFDWQIRSRRPANVLVIGGGGYTFPRAVKSFLPSANVDVVEIDPGVTAVSYSHLGLDPALGINSFHMDGRQFVAERGRPGAYDLITLDAVNDLSVPYHLLTKEFNDAVKSILAPEGIYTVTVIDNAQRGQLWKATLHTLRQTFPYVETLTYTENWRPEESKVLLLYASNRPMNLTELQGNIRKRSSNAAQLYQPSVAEVNALLGNEPAIILTDEYAPVDQFMSAIFRNRK